MYMFAVPITHKKTTTQFFLNLRNYTIKRSFSQFILHSRSFVCVLGGNGRTTPIFIVLIIIFLLMPRTVNENCNTANCSNCIATQISSEMLTKKLINEFLELHTPCEINKTIWQLYQFAVASNEFDNLNAIQRSNLFSDVNTLTTFITKLELITPKN